MTDQASNYTTEMGYKGNSHIDTGLFYAPYVPLASTPTIHAGHHHMLQHRISERRDHYVINKRMSESDGYKKAYDELVPEIVVIIANELDVIFMPCNINIGKLVTQNSCVHIDLENDVFLVVLIQNEKYRFDITCPKEFDRLMKMLKNELNYVAD